MAKYHTTPASPLDPQLEFCRLCAADSRPPVAEFAAAYPGLAINDLAAILRADLRFAWSAGERTRCETYFRIFPQLAHHPDSAVDVIYTEYLLREELGERPSLDEWTSRFPAFAEELCQQIEFHRSLNEFASDVTVSAAARASTNGEATESIRAAETHPRSPIGDSALTGHTAACIAAHELPCIPGFQVIEEVGRGGMGVVYRARQQSLGRDVALKFLYRADFASENQLVRFQREAAAISRLRHPHFVQIYDYGTHDRCPYLVLEYVEGGTLGDKIAGVEQPLEFATACVESLAAAMQYAHQHGIVHRDLKPSNVLMSADGVFKITDLGLARQLSADDDQPVVRHTESGSVIGTPAYMAPEQLSGEVASITASTDIYALGVILYELLTGTLPFHAANLFDLLSQVQAHEPISPRDLRPAVSRDLETICLKCLQKEPAKRYASAADLAQDLHNLRGGKPILARPIRAPERVWRWARRNPLVASLVTIVFLLLAGGLWISTFLYVRASTQAKRADQNYQVALQAVEKYLSNISESPDLKSYGMEPLRRKLLTTAQEFYEQLLQQQSAEFEVTAKLAEAHYRLASIQSELGDRAAAIQQYTAAEDAYRRLTEQQPDVPDHAYWLALCNANLGGKLQELGDSRQAEVYERRACEICQQLCQKFPHDAKYQLYYLNFLSQLVLLYGETNQPLLEKASREEAGQVYRTLRSVPQADLSDDELYQVHKKMGAIFWQHGMLKEALDSFKAMREVCGKLAEQFSDLPIYQYELATSESYVSVVSQKLGNMAEARQADDAAAELLEKLTQRYPLVTNYRFRLAVHWMNRGSREFAQASWNQAEAYWKRSREIVEALRSDFPAVEQYTLTLAQLAVNLGNTYYSRQEFEAARDEFQTSLECGLGLTNAHPENVEYQDLLGGAYHGLGTAQQALKQYDQAQDSLQKARTVREQLASAHADVPDYQSYLASTLHNLALVYKVTDRRDMAESSYRAASAVLQPLCSAYPDTLIYSESYTDTLNALGNILLDDGRVQDAIAEYDRGREILEGLVKRDTECLPYRTKLAHMTYNLGRSHLRLRDAAAASGYFEQAAKCFRESSSDPDLVDVRESVTDCLIGLARSRYRLGQYTSALDSLAEAEPLASESQLTELQALRARCQAHQP